MAYVAESGPVEWVVFAHTFTAVVERLPPGTITAKLKTDLRAAGFDLDRKALVAYPQEVWVKFTYILSKALFPHLEEPQAHRRFGELLIEGYAQTTMGKAVMALLRIIGPRRGLTRTAKSFRSGNNYFETRFEEVGPNTFHWWVNETGTHPQMLAGMVFAAMKDMGVAKPEVEFLDSPGPGRTYRVAWT